MARRAKEIGAGIMLTDDSVSGIRSAVSEILNKKSYRIAAKECSADFRSCPGTTGAAEFIENAPHTSNGVDILTEVNKANAKFQCGYWLVVLTIIVLIGIFVGWKYVWMIGLAAGILFAPIGKSVGKKNCSAIVQKLKG